MNQLMTNDGRPTHPRPVPTGPQGPGSPTPPPPPKFAAS